MKPATDRPVSELELRMLELADANGGHVKLDFANDLHYEFFLECHGGADRIRSMAPDLSALVERQRTNSLIAPAEDNELGLSDFEDIRETKAEVVLGADADPSDFSYLISGTPSASYANGVEGVSILSRIIDLDNNRIIYEDTAYPSLDRNLVYSTEVNVNVPAKQYGRVHAYRTSALFSKVSSAGNGEVCLNGGYVSSTAFTVSSNADIQSIELIDPIQKHLAERKQQSGNFEDYICVSYQRDWTMKVPDYSFEVNVPHGVTLMPVHMKFELVVKLRHEAYFSPDENGSYLYKDFDPQINLSRFDNEKQEPISGGAAPLLQDWVDFSQKNITVEEKNGNNQAIALRLKFPDDWKSNLKSAVLMDIATYADFYAKITFNTCNKDDKGVYHRQPTSIFVMWLYNPPQPYNPTAPGVNTIHTPRFYYQWGCLARDVELLTPDGPKLACDVCVGDVLISRGGKEVTVRDVQTGPQWEMVRITTQTGGILLTKDHTVCTRHGNRPAGDIRPGDMLWSWDAVRKEEKLVAVEQVEWVVYDDTVYNFLFDQATFIIGNGLLVGDYTLQQTVRNVPRAKLPTSSNAGNRIMTQMRALSGDYSLPAFVSSNEPESLALHYFAVKALAIYDDTFSEEDAQAIAEYCQYAADNATTGGVRVGEISLELNKSGLCTPAEEGFMVPIIPTAMEAWYDDSELKSHKPWLLPPDKDKEDRKYDMIKDVLKPFHFPPVSGKNPQVTFNSKALQELLGTVAERASRGLDRQVKMAIGLAVHLLADSMLHERFSAERDWRNLGRKQQVLDPDGADITDKYSPYRNYPFEEYSPVSEYPAGLQQISRVMHDSFARIDYIYPISDGELPLDEQGCIQYGGHRTPVNMNRFTRACKEIMSFLVKCRGKRFDETTWDKVIAPIFETLFTQNCTSFDQLAPVWKAQFANVNFSYDAKAIYERMVNGDPAKINPLEKYDEFYCYTILLYNIKNKGGFF